MSQCEDQIGFGSIILADSKRVRLPARQYIHKEMYKDDAFSSWLSIFYGSIETPTESNKTIWIIE